MAAVPSFRPALVFDDIGRTHELGAPEMKALEYARIKFHLLLQSMRVMKIARISAACREGGGFASDRTVLATCGVDGDDQIIAGDWPGLLVDHGVHRPLVFRMSEHAEIVYGTGVASESTSLGRTPVRTGERFRIGSEANYEIEQYHVHTEEIGDATTRASRMARVTAACVDSCRDEEGLTLFCVVDDTGRVACGDWLGYESNGEDRMPFVLCNRAQAVFEYRNNIAEQTTFRSCRVGKRFDVRSFPGNRPEVRHFEVVNCEML